jgi:hypothetical protein
MEVLLVLATTAANLLCFVIAVKVVQKVSKGEDIELPEVNPVTLIKERQDKKQAEREQSRIETILQNVEAYDGTGMGQKDVPRG